MTASKRAKVRLTLTVTTFVTNEQEVERGPTEQSLLVDQEVLQKMVSWGESLGWRQPTLKLRHLQRHAVAALVGTLRAALEDEQTVPNGSRAMMSTRNMMKDFFAAPKNRQQLTRVLDFLSAGGELTVVEGA